MILLWSWQWWQRWWQSQQDLIQWFSNFLKPFLLTKPHRKPTEKAQGIKTALAQSKGGHITPDTLPLGRPQGTSEDILWFGGTEFKNHWFNWFEAIWKMNSRHNLAFMFLVIIEEPYTIETQKNPRI